MVSARSTDPPSRVLPGPGPSDVPKSILEALAQPTVGHLDPYFLRVMDEVSQMLRDLHFGYWGRGRRNHHHTAPMNMIFALLEAPRSPLNEGPRERYARHARSARALWAGLRAMGFEPARDGREAARAALEGAAE